MIVEGTTASARSMTSVLPPSRTSHIIGGEASQSLTAAQGTSIPRGNNAPPFWRSVTATKKSPPTSLIKVVNAKMTANAKKGGKPSFTPISQTYLQLTEATATVGHVCEQLRNNWGSEHTVVTTEGLEVEDCSTTQCQYTLLCLHISAVMFDFLLAGLAFWKSPRRKFYAVTFSDL